MLVLALAGSAHQARADEDKGAQPETKKKTVVEEIVVTATKREQSIQKVPIAVSAFSGEDLAKRGVEDLTSLQNVSPSLNIYSSNTTSNGGTIRIRGVGTTGNNAGLESAVGSFIDGVYRSRSGLAFGDLVDVERVEVLRGPQGTLFGKNTTAGAVHILTMAPEFDWHGGGQITVGNYDQTSGKASITGPLIAEKLAFRMATFWTHRDGAYEKIGSGENFDVRDRKGVRGQLLLNTTDAFSFRLIGDWTERNESCCPATYRMPVASTLPPDPPRSASQAILFLGGTQDVSYDTSRTSVGTNQDPFEDVSDWGLSGEANWDLALGKLTSITGWRQFRVGRGQDIDFSDVDILRRPNGNETFNNWSQELRLAGSTDRVDWLVGAYGYTERIRNSGAVRFGSQGGAYINALSGAPAGLFPADTGYRTQFWQNTSGWALFTHDTVHITDPLSFTAGFRWSDETKQGFGKPNGAQPNQIINDPAAPYCVVLGASNAIRQALCDNAGWAGDRRERAWTGTFNFAYAFSDDANAYLGYSRGYKAGGFNLDVNANEAIVSGGVIVPGAFANAYEFDPESVDLYELGLKTRFLDDRVSLNTAVFYQKFKGFQLNTFTGLGFYITNTPLMVSQGVEVEAMMNLYEGVYATIGGTYAPARYGNSHKFRDEHRGNIITQAPRFQGNASIDVEQPLFDTAWMWLVGSNLSYRSGMNTSSDLGREKYVGPVWLWNGQIGLRTPSERWTAWLWGENLTNKRYMTVGFNSVFQTGSFSAFTNTPRLYGLKLEYAY